MPNELRDVKIAAAGTSTSYGFYCADTGGFATGSIVTGSMIAGLAASGANYGVYFDGGGGGSLTVQQSEVRANGGASSYGVRSLSGSLTVRHSRLAGTTASLYSTSSVPPTVVFTQLDGPVL